MDEGNRPVGMPRPLWSLFVTGYLQVIFVAANTIFITEHSLIPNLLTAFGISWLWTSNVRGIVWSGKGSRFAYAIGAALGSISGATIAGMMT